MKKIFEIWLDKGNKVVSLIYYNDWDKHDFWIHTNGAKLGNPKHSCFDLNINFFKFHFSYTNFNYNRKYRDTVNNKTPVGKLSTMNGLRSARRKPNRYTNRKRSL